MRFVHQVERETLTQKPKECYLETFELGTIIGQQIEATERFDFSWVSLSDLKPALEKWLKCLPSEKRAKIEKTVYDRYEELKWAEIQAEGEKAREVAIALKETIEGFLHSN
jgi:hypothetical protein